MAICGGVRWPRTSNIAFQTAVALAEYSAQKDSEGIILLKDKHLKSVLDMSRDFKKYLDTLYRGNQGKRAARESMRLDNFWIDWE